MQSDYDNITDDILKPREKMAKLEAEKIWNDYCDKKIPVELNDIIQKLGVEVREFEFAKNMSGDIKMEAEVCLILYNKNMSTVKKRFTVAHEIGHIILEHTSILESCEQASRKSQEREAETFAGELLIPSRDIKNFFNKCSRSIEDVTKRYWVSRDAAFISIKKNNLLHKIKN